MISIHVSGKLVLRFDPRHMADLSATCRIKWNTSLVEIFNSTIDPSYDYERIGFMCLSDPESLSDFLGIREAEREFTVVSAITNMESGKIELISTTIKIVHAAESVEFADDAYISIEVVTLRDDKGDTENDHSN